jgi:uncharacterized membrane protein (UPF0127 family)
MSPKALHASLLHNGVVLIPYVVLANRFLRRLLGYMGKSAPACGVALYLNPCRSIHTCFMRFPIDIIFLDHHFHVVKLTYNLRPWRLALGPSSTQGIIEIPSGNGAIATIRIGDTLMIQ